MDFDSKYRAAELLADFFRLQVGTGEIEQRNGSYRSRENDEDE